MKKRILIPLTIAVLFGVPEANAAKVTADAVTTCESAYRERNKADNAAAPEGYKVKREKGYKAKFIAECLSE